jgi:hypothetical protein
MASVLNTYLQDHLAGAQFAVSLLHDLTSQEVDAETAILAAKLLPEIEEDRTILERLVTGLGCEESAIKQAIAWFTQKAGRLKLSLGEPVGIFEAMEVLALGVLGKLALWNALRAIQDAESLVARLDFETLCQRAEQQHAAIEQLRLRLAIKAFGQSGE